MAMRGETWRFWTPVLLLLAMAAYAGQKLVRSHVDPKVTAPTYDFEREQPARRGTIYSAYGERYPLVKSVPFWEYALDPLALTNAVVRRRGEPRRTKYAIVRTIADALGADYKKLKRMVDAPPHSGWRNQPLGLSSDPEVHRILADSTLVAGVAIHDRQVRQYLHGRRLSHVLGSVNADHVGSAGIEQRFNRELSGTPGMIRGRKDARGFEIYDKRTISIDPVPGADVYLTIDHNIQFEAESALKWGLSEYGAGTGWCIVMDAKTAAVLAMASLPDFDPLLYGRTTEAQQLNRAIAFNYEPGSVMKVITVRLNSVGSSPSQNLYYIRSRDRHRRAAGQVRPRDCLPHQPRRPRLLPAPRRRRPRLAGDDDAQGRDRQVLEHRHRQARL